MKHYFTVFSIALSLCAGVGGVLWSCADSRQDGGTLVATIEPLHWMLDQIADGHWTTASLVPEGFSPEDYSPSARQMTQLSTAAALFKAGRLPVEIVWVPKAQSAAPALRVVDTSRGLRKATFDPHTWTSPRNVRLILANMSAALCGIDTANAVLYNRRLTRAQATVDSIDGVLTAMLAELPSRTFVIAHPALTHFAADYDLRQLAIETDGKEPTPASLKALVAQARAEGVKVVFVQREFSDRSARIVADQIGARVVQINPLAYDWPGQMIHIAQSLKDGR